MAFRKPQLVPILFIIASTLLLSSLGAWQLERMQWKNTVLKEIESARRQPSLDRLPMEADGFTYRNAALSGQYLADKTLHFVGNKANGYVWLVPFKEKHSKQIILVSAGWVPSSAAEATLPEATGILRPMRRPRLFSPENHPEKNLWFSENKEAMETASSLAFYPLILDTMPPTPLRNDHLGYAITWFALACVGLVMFVFYHRIPAAKNV